MSSTFNLNSIGEFIDRCRLEGPTGRYASYIGGHETLYASTFACMLLEYLGKLDRLPDQTKGAWADYINQWQDPETGYFIGPELIPTEMQSKKHSYEHIAQHLTAHALPALNLLGSKPIYPLRFAYPYLDTGYLQSWLDKRDWHDAWLEGNNLLFIGQFLIYLRDHEQQAQADLAMKYYFDWLDQRVDPATGLWGSNGFCSVPAALYGGYHQLLAYYYENHPLPYPESLIDTALTLQHADGGFHPDGGGGACEDVDAVDILVNLYKLIDYRRVEIRLALRRALTHLMSVQMPDGGFVYRKGAPFIHMGIQRTASPADQSNLFPTWFRVHTLALISEILTDEPVAAFSWKFNRELSMGWHRSWDRTAHKLTAADRLNEGMYEFNASTNSLVRSTFQGLRRSAGKVKRGLLGSGSRE